MITEARFRGGYQKITWSSGDVYLNPELGNFFELNPQVASLGVRLTHDDYSLDGGFQFILWNNSSTSNHVTVKDWNGSTIDTITYNANNRFMFLSKIDGEWYYDFLTI